MKRRNYIKSVGASFVTPLIPASALQQEEDEEEVDATAYIKRYDVGTIITVAVPTEVDALSISVQIETDGDQLDHKYIDSAKTPIETLDGKSIWHFFHQFRDATETIHLNFSGQKRESIEVEQTEQNILGNPWIDFVHEKTRKVGEIDYATMKILNDGVQMGFELDSDYDWLSFETYDGENSEWVEHRWEQIYYPKVDDSRWGSMCECETPVPTVFREAGRLKLFGIKDGEKEHIPLIRRRGDLQR